MGIAELDMVELLTIHFWASLMTGMVKDLPAMQETQVRSLGWEDPIEEEMPTHSSILARIITQRKLVGYSPCSHKESDTTGHAYL